MDGNRLIVMNRILYRIIRGFLRLIGRLPLEAREFLALHLGRLFFAINKHHREIAIKNLTIAFGKEKTAAEIREIANRAFENLGRIMFEIGWTMQMPESQFQRHFKITGLKHYRQAAELGKGVFILTAHFGNWELLPIAGHMAGMSVGMVYRPIDLPALDQVIKENRSRFGGLPIMNRKGATRDIFRAMKKGYSVGLLIDQNEGKRRGIFVDFFNYKACTNPGLAKLVMKTGAPVVPFFLFRENNTFTAEFGAALHPIRTGDYDADIATNTQKYNDTIESYIRRYPEQWFWVHNRWKTRPVAGYKRPKSKRNRLNG